MQEVQAAGLDLGLVVAVAVAVAALMKMASSSCVVESTWRMDSDKFLLNIMGVKRQVT